MHHIIGSNIQNVDNNHEKQKLYVIVGLKLNPDLIVHYRELI